jgi:hypothetical protein
MNHKNSDERSTSCRLTSTEYRANDDDYPTKFSSVIIAALLIIGGDA